MHFTTPLLALLAATATALPGTPIQERQATPTAYLRFWNPPTGGNTCGAPLAEDFVATQDMTMCDNLGITNPYKAENITGNTLTRTCKSERETDWSGWMLMIAVRLYALKDCDESGPHFDVAPLTDYTCFTQTVLSAKII